MDYAPEDLNLRERYKVLTGFVLPRPIAWVTSVGEAGVVNAAPFSFFNVFCEDPPLCMFAVNNRPDARPKDTFVNIAKSGEFVVNLADEGTANALHATGAEIPESESEFARAGLTPVPAKTVKHPRIAEAAASLECRVERRIRFGPEREMVVGEILLVHAREGIIDPATKRISEALYRPIGRLYGTRYCTTRQRFDLPGELP